VQQTATTGLPSSEAGNENFTFQNDASGATLTSWILQQFLIVSTDSIMLTASPVHGHL